MERSALCHVPSPPSAETSSNVWHFRVVPIAVIPCRGGAPYRVEPTFPFVRPISCERTLALKDWEHFDVVDPQVRAGSGNSRYPSFAFDTGKRHGNSRKSRAGHIPACNKYGFQSPVSCHSKRSAECQSRFPGQRQYFEIGPRREKKCDQEYALTADHPAIFWPGRRAGGSRTNRTHDGTDAMDPLNTKSSEKGAGRPAAQRWLLYSPGSALALAWCISALIARWP